MLKTLNTYKIYIIAFVFFVAIASIISSYILLNYENEILTKRNEAYETYIITTYFQDIINYMISYIEVGVYMISLYKYPLYNITNYDLINLTELRKSPYLSMINELRLHYNISNNERINFEQNIASISNTAFKIKDSNITDVYIADTRSYYCPITFLLPNVTKSLYPYIGVDICNINTYKNIIYQLETNNTLALELRKIRTNNKIILDIAKKSENGFAIISFIIDDIVNIISNKLNTKHYINYQLISNNINYIYCNNCTYIRNYTNTLHFDDYNVTFILYSNNTIPFPISFVWVLCGCIAFILISLMVIVFATSKYKLIEISQKREFASYMLSYINHEMRNPLNAIKGLLDISIDNFNDKDITNSEINVINSNLHTASNTCDYLEHLINDILDIQKLIEKRLNIVNTIIFTNNLKSKIYKILSLKLNEKPNVIFTFTSIIDSFISDETRITQILLNFISNSIKFTEKGFISVNFYSEDENLIFSVKDSGRGISDEFKTRIFEPYEQTDVNDTLRHGGVGLGLYLCKMLAERLNGSVYFESQLHVGSTFYLKIPANNKI